MKAIATLSFLFFVFQQAHAFRHSDLRDITREVTDNTTFAVNFTAGGIITFTDRAKDQIQRASGRGDRSFAAHRHINDDWHFYNERFADATERLIQLKAEIVADPDPDSARETFGQALHTLQEFYSHTNWVELGSGVIETKLGREIIPDANSSAVMCSNGVLSDSGLTDLTSSYNRINRRVPDGKCSRDDLDKEDSDNPMFAAARALAVEATADYLEQIVEAFAGDEAAIRRFADRDAAVMFVIDTTESMRVELIGIKTSASGIIEQYNESQIGRYILIEFHDGEGDDAIRETTITADPDEFLTAVEALKADSDGLGSCREAGWTAMNNAVDLTERDSKIYFWSDAAQRRLGRWPLVPRFYFRWYSAIFKHTRVQFVLTGNCLPSGTSYRGFNTVARIIGGSVILADESEVGTIDYSA
jgi:hypothetical protein